MTTRLEDWAVWWLSPADCEAIGDELPMLFPEPIAGEYRSLRGRNGRGRLWTAAHPTGDVHCGWDVNPLTEYLVKRCGGIVVPAQLLGLLVGLPGVVTDLWARRWPAAPEPLPTGFEESDIAGGMFEDAPQLDFDGRRA